MRVLWITYILFPEAENLLKGNSDFKSSGGWLLGALEGLLGVDGIELSIVSFTKAVTQPVLLTGSRCSYQLIPWGWSGEKSKSVFSDIHNTYKPDVVHIHGTEHSQSLDYIKMFGADNVVVSIQGVISEIAKYYTKGMTTWEIIRNITIRDVFFKSILGEKNEFRRRGEMEKKILREVKYVIGRTTFDKAQLYSINPSATYFFCNESLRDEFYKGKWQYDNCKKHSIFLSQASYPIKGLHQFLKVIPMLLEKYPDTTVYVAGYDITRRKESRIRKLLRPGYGKMISKIIRNLKIEDYVFFTGALSADEMKSMLLQANVFVCPSYIENSPNSLGEAQLLGVPCIATYTGGIPDFVKNDKCGALYNYDDINMLRYLIEQVYDNSQLFDSTEMVRTAKERHDPFTNRNQLINIYKEITKIERL